MTIFAPAWRPAADVYVTPTTVEVTLEIPGVNLHDMDVALVDNALIVRGRRHLPDLDPRGVYHVVEISRGTFRVEIALPARVEANPRKLQCELGLLVVSFNKLESTDGGD